MNRRSRFLWGFLIVTTAGILACGSTFVLRPSTTLPTYGMVPTFTLTDETGLPFESARLSGHVWIADFIFTSCAGQCPQMTEAMRHLQRRLPSEVRSVSITVDPTRDTPTVLHQYAKNVGADPNRWHFLTGESASIEQLAKEGFLLSYAEGVGPKEPIAHSVRLVLVDRQGTIRGYYDGTDPKAVQQLLKDAKALWQNRPSGQR